MKNTNVFHNMFVIGIILLFVGASIIPSMGEIIVEKHSTIKDDTNFFNSYMRGNILYVGGSGPSNYTNIQDAIDEAIAGDKVFVFGGIYEEDIELKDGVDVIGEGADVTTIKGTSSDVNVVTATNVNDAIFSGFTISITRPTAGSGCSILIEMSSFNIHHNIIRDAGIGISLMIDSDVLINNNVFYTDFGGIAILNDQSSPTIKNNIIMSYTTGILADGASFPVVSYINIYNCVTEYDGLIPVIGNISLDPLFVNPSLDNFNLQNGSPCIDAGDPFDPVPAGGEPFIDMGVFEYLPSGSPPQIMNGPVVTVISDTEVNVQWTTDVPCNSYVFYGLEEDEFPQEESDFDLRLIHDIDLNDLQPSSTYNYKVHSVNSQGVQVESQVGYFETFATSDSIPPSLEVDVPSVIYGPTPVTVEATDNIGVDRFEFYLDDEYKYTAFADSFQWMLDTNGVSNGLHNLRVRAYDRAGGTTEDDISFGVEVPPMDMSSPEGWLVTPYPGEMVSGSMVKIKIWCLDSDSGIEKTVFYVNDEQLHVDNINGGLGVEEYSEYYWNSYGVENGEDHEIKVEVYNNAGGLTNLTSSVSVDNAGDVFEEAFDPLFAFKLIKLTRGQVKREGVYYEAKLYVQNIAPIILYDVVVTDCHYGFQAIQSEYGYLPTVYFDSNTKCSNVSFLIGNLMPGEIKECKIYMVPILFGTDPYNIDYTIGQRTDICYKRLIGNYQFEKYHLQYNVPAVKMIDGWWSTTEIPINKYTVLDPFYERDYLVVTHPRNLYSLNYQSEVNALLSELAEFVRHKNGILAYLDTNPSKNELLNAISLNKVVSPSSGKTTAGGWSHILRPGWTNDGYMLIVGETEIVPSFTVTLFTQDNTYTIPLSDQPYADINDDGYPDLKLGRIIGNDAGALIEPIKTSLGVHLNRQGYEYDASDILLISGIGAGYNSFFAQNVNFLSYIFNNFYNPPLGNTKLHLKDYVISHSFPLNLQDSDRMELADLGLNSDEEIIIADDSADQIKIISKNGFLHYQFPYDFDENDELVVGDIMGDSDPEIIIADKSANTIDIIHCHHYGTYWDNWYITGLSTSLQHNDKIAVGEVAGTTDKLDIIISDVSSQQLIIRSNTGGNSFSIDTLSCSISNNHDLDSGNLTILTRDEIVIGECDGFSKAGNKIKIYTSGALLVGQFTRSFEEEDSLCVGNTISNGYDDIVILDADMNRIYHYFNSPQIPWNNPKSEHTPIAISLDNYDHLAVGQLFVDTLEEMIIGQNSYDKIYFYNRYFKNRMHPEFLVRVTNKDLVFYFGHGYPGGWADVLDHADFPFNTYGVNPFVFATSCSTGNYEIESDNSIAESYIEHGAGVFIGATRMSNTGRNKDAGVKFYGSYWRPNKNVGTPFRAMERHLWTLYSQDPKWWRWVLEYNIYGDPKYRAQTEKTNKMINTIDQPDPFSESILLDIPDFVVTSENGTDYVEIPGGEKVITTGEYQVPYWLYQMDIPVGIEIQDVILNERSGQQIGTGLKLPFNPEDMVYSDNDTQQLPEHDTWFPDVDYHWNVIENISGDDMLMLMAYPFFYNSNTSDYHFFKQFNFSITYDEIYVEITELTLDEEVINPNSPLDGLIELNNMIDDNQSVHLRAEVESYAGLIYSEGMPLKTIEIQPGYSAIVFSWDTTSIPNGQYKIKFILEEQSGKIYDLATKSFTIGSSTGNITQFYATPDLFNISDPIDITLAFVNTGTNNINGSANITISNSTGDIIKTLNLTITELIPSDEIIFEDTWNTSAILADKYTVQAVVKFDDLCIVAPSILIREFSTIINNDTFMSFNPKNTTVVKGEEFKIDVYIDPCQAVGGWEINISYTPGLINATRVDPGLIWEENFNPGTINNENGTITLVGSEITESFPDFNHTICAINFTANSTGMCYLLIDYAYVTNSSSESIIVFTEYSSVEIVYNAPPEISYEYPEDGSTDVNLQIADLSVEIEDLEGDSFNWNIQTSPDIGSSSGTGELNGTKTCPISDLEYDTTYTWFVTATDSGSGQTTEELYIFTTESSPSEEPDLDCSGTLSWDGIIPGETVIGTITVENVGDHLSLLDWEVDSYPTWGTWSFVPDCGVGLLAGSSIIIDVDVVAPDVPDTEFTGEVLIVNSINPLDFCTIDVSLITLPCTPDLDCSGTLSWTGVTPGETVAGTFTVENDGEPLSLLDWELSEYPTWGTWSIDPESGTSLEQGDTITIDVEVVAPNVEDDTFTGEVVIVNSNDPSDTCTIDVSLATPVSQEQGNQQIISRFLQIIIERYPLLRQLLGL